MMELVTDQISNKLVVHIVREVGNRIVVPGFKMIVEAKLFHRVVILSSLYFGI